VRPAPQPQLPNQTTRTEFQKKNDEVRPWVLLLDVVTA
jgi:hypothetical protein